MTDCSSLVLMGLAQKARVQVFSGFSVLWEASLWGGRAFYLTGLGVLWAAPFSDGQMKDCSLLSKGQALRLHMHL